MTAAGRPRSRYLSLRFKQNHHSQRNGETDVKPLLPKPPHCMVFIDSKFSIHVKIFTTLLTHKILFSEPSTLFLINHFFSFLNYFINKYPTRFPP